jgi:chemotaxis signal transduction protein
MVTTKRSEGIYNRLPALTFYLGQQVYALLIEEVVEVAAMVERITVADAPPEILGMANRHGTILPLLDLRVVFKQEAPPITSSTLFIVVSGGGRLAGLVVDEIRQVEYLDMRYLREALGTGKYIRGIISYKEHLIQIIALPALINNFLVNETFEGVE